MLSGSQGAATKRAPLLKLIIIIKYLNNEPPWPPPHRRRPFPPCAVEVGLGRDGHCPDGSPIATVTDGGVAGCRRLQLVGRLVSGGPAQWLWSRPLRPPATIYAYNMIAFVGAVPAAASSRVPHPTVDRPLSARMRPGNRLCCLQGAPGRMYSPTQQRLRVESDGCCLGGGLRIGLHGRQMATAFVLHCQTPQDWLPRRPPRHRSWNPCFAVWLHDQPGSGRISCIPSGLLRRAANFCAFDVIVPVWRFLKTWSCCCSLPRCC